MPPRLGRFVVQRLLGRGAFGSVYLATDPSLSREVAIKLPHEGLTLALRERFMREARSTAAIHHPNVCPVHEIGMYGEMPFIVMHYAAGTTLASYLDRHETLPPLRAAAVAQQLAEGVAAAHEKGITHRDLKPGNVMFDPVKLRPVITDFGLALLANEASTTAEKGVCGTPAYMSPEQTRGKADEVGPLSDVYSLGVILFRMLTGEVPFRGPVFAVMTQHAKAPPPLPSQVRPGLDPRLDAIVLKAMAKRPSDRYASAKAFADELAAYVRTGDPALAVTESDNGTWRTGVATGAPGAPRSAPSRSAADPGRTADPDEGSVRAKLRAAGWLVSAAIMVSVAAVLVTAVSLRKPNTIATPPEVANGTPNSANRPDKPDPVPALPFVPVPKKVADPAPLPKGKEPPPVIPPKPTGGDVPEKAPPPKPVEAAKRDDLPLLAARLPIGRVATDNALVLSYRTGADGAGAWTRLPFKAPTEPRDEASVFSSDPAMALPGYKASVVLGEPDRPTVDVLLWGNVPELLPYRVLESKAVFHQPAAGFDADLTLHAGRVYLKSVKRDADGKSLPVKVRVRLASTTEMWDVTLPNEKADVLVELISWYKPGTAFSIKGGADPRREARVAVVRGPVGFDRTTGERFASYGQFDGGTQADWDSVTGRLSGPTASANRQEIDRLPTLDGEFYKLLTRVLSEMAKPVADAGSLAVVLKDRMDLRPNLTPAEEPTATLSARLAIYALGATAPSTEAGAQALQPLIDTLNSPVAWTSRQAAVTALVQWVGRERGNTALIHALMSKPDTGIQPATTADAVVEMLRGYVSPVNPDPSALDTLVTRLGGLQANQFEKPGQAIALRDVALWNLAVAEQGVWTPAPFRVNIAAEKPDDPKYKQFVEFWVKRVQEIKKRPKSP